MEIDGRRLHVVESNSGSVVSRDTVLTLRRNDTVIEGSYAGGAILAGFLVGFILDGDPSRFDFRYVQADSSGNLDSGMSTAVLEELRDGRLRMIERYHWITRDGSGINIFEEVPGSAI
jgi:hypothetical protein